MDTLSIWIDLFKDVGFPFAIAVYLLLRFEKKIEHFSKTIEDLQKIIQTIKDE
ncbi:MAG TPA: YvrJ family protein [Virgibacillus sp.]|nr:YvrJ family protein [Virgibacillus sp.]